MVEHKSLIKAYQSLLVNYQFEETDSFTEQFAIKRYYKKMEIPDVSRSNDRRLACQRSFVDYDSNVTTPWLPPQPWYKARLLIHNWMRGFKLQPTVITNGSEEFPTYGFNSIESKLMRSKWRCTIENFDLWADLAYRTLAIKRATRSRFAAVMGHKRSAIQRFHKESWRMFDGEQERKFLSFKRMLSKVTFVTYGSRFSSVRKNNEIDRPIDLQPLCNMLVQRSIGQAFRDVLRRQGIDLNKLSDQHRRLIKNRDYATIDLRNASDSISLGLVKFLFPDWVFRLINQSRTQQTRLLDGSTHVLRKVSSMGNGFTFEAMSLILTALGKSICDDFSVFGDDIIIPNKYAHTLVNSLVAVGFEVNSEKSFINSRFRESCGANYHDDFGYIQSFDFEYPESIHDCIVVHNKVSLLAMHYPQFKRLHTLLHRCVPRLLQGPGPLFLTESGTDTVRGYVEDVSFSSYFWSKRTKGSLELKTSVISSALEDYQLLDVKELRSFYGFIWKPSLATRMVCNIKMRRHTGKYFMYLFGLRRTPDIITGRGSWQRVHYVQVGQRAFRVKDLVRR